MTEKQDGTIDLGALIDDGRLTAFQIKAMACCAAVAFFDGLDTQSIGVAGPLISQAFHLPPGSLGPVFSAGQLGAMIGAVVSGAIGDRIGRKPTLLGAVLLMALGTIVTALATSIPTFMAARLVAGLGLGAATPCFVALTAEYAPARIRGAAVSVIWAAFPLGGFVGSLINPILAKEFGWQSIFYFGGGVPLLIGIVCALYLPESLRYLAASNADTARIRAVVRWLAPAAADATQFTFAEPTAHRGSFLALLQGGRAVTTALLWVLFMITFSALLFLPLWVPSMLSGPAQLTLSQAAFVGAMSNLGSVFGTASFGRLFDRFGAGRVMAIAYLVGAPLFMAIGIPGLGLGWASAASFVSSLCLGGASAGALTLAASVYPTVLRSMGVGSAMSMARLAQIGNALLVGTMLAAGWRNLQVFYFMGGAILVAAVAASVLAFARRREDGRLAPQAAL